MAKSTPSSQANLLQPRDWPIEQLPGLSPEDEAKLKQVGITTTFQLLQRTRNLGQRQALAAQLKIHIQYVHKWAALADLARIPAVGCQYCGLLLHGGISSSAQLAQVPLHALNKQVLRFYVTHLQRRDLCPATSQLVEWIHQAQRLSRRKPAMP